MGVHMPPSPMPYQASRRGGRSRHGRTLWNGIAAPAAVVQPQRGQRHAESATCPSEWRSRVHPPPMSDGHSPIGTHPGWLAFKTDGSATRLG